METFRILIADAIARRGIDLLRAQPGFVVDEQVGLKEDQLCGVIGGYHAVIVRSQPPITRKVIAAANQLRVIGRAGVGVDNVDVEAATQRGIIVMNTPGGNTISTAEHTFSLMLALARNIPQAHASVKAGQWDRKSFGGVELYNKTLGVIGMGRIGGEVARRAIAFGMRVLAYDPFLSSSRARALQVEVVELDELYRQADFITVHVPSTEQTKGMIDRVAMGKMKQGVRLVNCARGGIIAEADLAAAITAGQVAGAALDVYEQEPPGPSPLRALPQVVMTPHLGASTHEAQESVGIEVAEQVRDCLAGGTIRNAVNMPALDAKTLAVLQPYLSLGETLGRVLAQIAAPRMERLVVEFAGKAAEVDADPVTRAVLTGFLQKVEGPDVNYVNAPSLAKQLGLQVSEVKSTEPVDYAELLAVRVKAEGATASVAGTFYGSVHNPRIVRINEMPVEAVPQGVLLLVTNQDRPGVVGWLGTILGRHRINIASMSLGRDAPAGRALTVLNLDSAPGAAVLAELRADPDILDAQVVRLCN